MGSRTEENPTPVLSFGGVFLPPCGMGKEKFFHQFYPPGQSDGLGGRVVFFFLFFLRKEADMLTRTMEDNLGEGEGDGCAGENLIFEY